MKVKKPKASDLVDSLKHLKISDRRFRPQLKGSTVHTLACLGEFSASCRYHCHMTRSASSATVAGYDFQCCKACEYCQALSKTGAGSEVMHNNDPNQVNDLNSCLPTANSNTSNHTENIGYSLVLPTSSFTKFSGYLCTTLPTRRCRSNYGTIGCDLNPLRVSSCFEPTHLRRSYGNELSEIEQDGANRSFVNQSPLGASSRMHVEHPLCCCHVVGSHLPLHLRLYRRLYSLVDHPCVSLYYPCKYHTCTHTTITSGCSTGVSTFRHSLSLRHRHTITPASIYRLSIESRTASCSKSLDTESELGATDTSPASNYCSMHQRIAIQSCLEQSAVKHKSQPAEDSLIGIQRCRRNSDPEHWQQFRNQQYNKFLTSGNMNENLEGDFSESGTLQNNPGNDEADYVGTQISRPVTKETGALESECKFHATDLSVGKSPDSFVDWNNIGYGCMLPNNAVFGHSVTGKTAPTSFPDCNVSNSVFTTLANQNYSFCQAKFSQSIDTLSQSENIVVSNDSITQQQQQRVCFRPSLLSSSEHAAPIMYTSDTCFSLHYNQPSVLNSSDMSTCNPPETAHNDQTALAYEPLVWSNDDASLMGPPDSKGKIHCIQSVNEADYLANTDLTCHVGNSKPQLVSDVSVNELASYMEHMVHIPGRMSEMAQRMYL